MSDTEHSHTYSKDEQPVYNGILTMRVLSSCRMECGLVAIYSETLEKEITKEKVLGGERSWSSNVVADTVWFHRYVERDNNVVCNIH